MDRPKVTNFIERIRKEVNIKQIEYQRKIDNKNFEKQQRNNIQTERHLNGEVMKYLERQKFVQKKQ